jgi:hypothetical protein
MFNVNLSLLTKGKAKGTCRICREIAELKTERMCGDCARVKAQIRTRIPQHLPKYTSADEASTQQPCTRSGCKCGACDARTLGPHPRQPSSSASGLKRETHFHPRCHELWLEVARGGANRELVLSHQA